MRAHEEGERVAAVDFKRVDTIRFLFRGRTIVAESRRPHTQEVWQLLLSFHFITSSQCARMAGSSCQSCALR